MSVSGVSAVPAAIARSLREEDERRLDNAIARRNTTWAYYEAATALLRAAEAAGKPEDVLRPLRGNYNDAQHDWEWAVRDLTRERVRFQFATGQHWSQR